jgi:hypothetical protein
VADERFHGGILPLTCLVMSLSESDRRGIAGFGG